MCIGKFSLSVSLTRMLSLSLLCVFVCLLFARKFRMMFSVVMETDKNYSQKVLELNDLKQGR